MKDKAEIVRDWLPRYTGRALADFGHYALFTNRRVWEHDDAFKEYLRRTRAIGIDALVELRDSGESVKHLRFET